MKMTDQSADNYVALLGTKGGPAIRPGSAMPTSNLLVLGGTEIVVDCGLGVTKGLVDQGFQLKNLTVIFITHMHSDHYLELGPLLHTAWTAGLNSVVEIWGPDGIEAYWEGFVASMKADIDLRIEDEGRPDLRRLVNIHTIDVGEFTQVQEIRVSAIRTIHPPLIDTFALSFKSDEKHVVFSGDTARLEPLEQFAKDTDLLVHEAMLEAALPALFARIGNTTDKLMKHLRVSHTFAHDAAITAQNAGAKRLALSHLLPSDDPDFTEKHWIDATKDHYSGELIVGKDGLRIQI